MKNTFLLAILLFQLTFVSGQSSNWGPWVQNSCFDGLYARFKKSDMYSEKYGRTWYIQFKNTYTQKIAFSFTAGDNKEDVDNNIANKRKGYRTELAANTTDDGLMWVTEFNETECRLGIGLLRFLGTNETDVNTLYANCKGGQLCSYCAINPVPNCPNYSKSKNSSSSTGTSTTQQNDLTEYNNSKADLERQIQEKNAQGQQKSQNYTTAINKGISAHNSGNYTEAKNQFSIALNNCNTDEARAKAQEYYKKSVDAEKSQAKIKMTGDLVQSGINTIYGIADAIKENKLRKEQKEEEAKIWLEKRKQEKLAKDEEEKLKFAELVNEAEKGSFDAQYEVAKKYGEDDEMYRSSLYFYEMAYNNPNKKLTEDFLIGYTDKLQDDLNLFELEQILFDSEYTTKYPRIKLKSAFYSIFYNKYYGGSADYLIHGGIKQLKELFNYDKYKIPEMVYAYMQVTGEYEKYGVPINEEKGFNDLKTLSKNKVNTWVPYYLGLIYLKGAKSIKKDEKKAKDYFRDCAGIDKNYTKSNAYNYIMLRLKGNKELSIYSPQILSYIEFAKLTETEKHDNGSLIPSEIFYQFPSYYASFIPDEDINFVAKYVPSIFGMRSQPFSGFDNDKNNRFGFSSFPEDNGISVILINYPLSWCKICFTQYEILKKINAIRFITIQVATAFDITKEQSYDLFYYEGGTRRTVNGNNTSVEVRQKISNGAVFYTNLKDFDISKINEKGSLPAIYFYKNNELKHVQAGLTDEKTINEIISQIK